MQRDALTLIIALYILVIIAETVTALELTATAASTTSRVLAGFDLIKGLSVVRFILGHRSPG